VTIYWFPDNTVLCNFAAVDKLPLLRRILDERGRWTDAVAQEADNSSLTLPVLRSVREDGWLGEPIEVSRKNEVEEIHTIRRVVFGGSSDKPTRHLGEAQTCYIIKNWPSFAGSHWITDDRDAYDYAKFQGITTRRTADLMSEAIQCAYLTQQSAYEIMQKMIDADRGLWLPPSASDL
jgi:predicted nucleic acid-binding protein